MSDTAKARGRLLAAAALRPDAVRSRRRERVVEPDTGTAHTVVTDQPRWRDAETFTDERNTARCGACRRAVQHRSQVRCPWLSCQAWFKGWGDV